MEVGDRAKCLTGLDGERRDMPRCVVDEKAVLLLVGHGGWVNCRIVELSLTGCRISTGERLPAGSGHRVEAVFKLRGVAFRFIGVSEWTDGQNLVGIRFEDMLARRRDELAGCCARWRRRTPPSWKRLPRQSRAGLSCSGLHGSRLAYRTHRPPARSMRTPPAVAARGGYIGCDSSYQCGGFAAGADRGPEPERLPHPHRRKISGGHLYAEWRRSFTLKDCPSVWAE